MKLIFNRQYNKTNKTNKISNKKNKYIILYIYIYLPRDGIIEKYIIYQFGTS